MIDPKIFGERIKRARKASRLTQKALAEIIGVGENAVHQIERGNNWPSLPSTVLLANHLGLSLDWLCGRDEAHPLVKGGEQVTSEQLARQLALTRATLMGLIQALEDQGAIIPPPNLEERMAQHWDQAAQQLGIPDDGADVDLTALWPPRRRP